MVIVRWVRLVVGDRPYSLGSFGRTALFPRDSLVVFANSTNLLISSIIVDHRGFVLKIRHEGGICHRYPTGALMTRFRYSLACASCLYFENTPVSNTSTKRQRVNPPVENLNFPLDEILKIGVQGHIHAGFLSPCGDMQLNTFVDFARDRLRRQLASFGAIRSVDARPRHDRPAVPRGVSK